MGKEKKLIILNRYLYIKLIYIKEMSFYHKFKFSNPYILGTRWRKPLIFQTYIIWSIRINRLKCLRSKTFGCKDVGIINSEFVGKTQFLWNNNYCYTRIVFHLFEPSLSTFIYLSQLIYVC